MKRITLISLALATILAGGVATAQPGPGSRPDPEAHLRNLSVLLDLSPQQQTELRTLLEAKREQMEARRDAREHLREERMADRQAFEQEIAAILDAEQQVKFEALKAERDAQRARHQARRAERRGEG